jgi:hypothetical protein
MGGTSSSSTRRTYNTTNLSQQGDGNVAGDNNRITIQRADALALEHIADVLGEGVTTVTDANVSVTGDIADVLGEGVTTVTDANVSVTGDAIELAKEVQQGAENGTQQAMDFVANWTEREQVGNSAEATKTVWIVAGVAGVTLVGIAWASRGGINA